MEKRVFYRIISGLHTSISTHICMEYFNQTTGTWVCDSFHLLNYPLEVNALYRHQTSNVLWIESVYIPTGCNKYTSTPSSSCEQSLALALTCQNTITVRRAHTKRMLRQRAFLEVSLILLAK